MLRSSSHSRLVALLTGLSFAALLGSAAHFLWGQRLARSLRNGSMGDHDCGRCAGFSRRVAICFESESVRSKRFPAARFLRWILRGTSTPRVESQSVRTLLSGDLVCPGTGGMGWVADGATSAGKSCQRFWRGPQQVSRLHRCKAYVHKACGVTTGSHWMREAGSTCQRSTRRPVSRRRCRCCRLKTS